MEYLDKPFVRETVAKFGDRKEGLAEWMLTSLEMVEKSLEETLMNEEPAIRAEEVWELVVRSNAKYERKYPRIIHRT